MKHPYDDIIDLPHHVSERHPQMSMYNRAAQFAPFAALTGHKAAITEAARLTEAEQELSESDAEVLNRKLAYLQSLDEKPTISVTYFVLILCLMIRKRVEVIIRRLGLSRV